jgi:flavodoxin
LIKTHHCKQQTTIIIIKPGLPIDQDNQDDLTPARVKAWAAQVLEEMGANVPA